MEMTKTEGTGISSKYYMINHPVLGRGKSSGLINWKSQGCSCRRQQAMDRVIMSK